MSKPIAHRGGEEWGHALLGGVDQYTVLRELHSAVGAAVVDWRRQRCELLREHLPS